MPAPIANTTNTIKVPITTPLTDASGNLTKAWIGFFKGIGDSDAVTVDTHQNRTVNFPATTRDLGQMYYESDRTVLYLNIYNAMTQQIWQWIAGRMSGTRTPDTRPTDLAVTTSMAVSPDIGFLFYATDVTTTYEWNGTAWTYQSGQASGTLSPDQRPVLALADAGFLFYSTDFEHLYQWTGTVWQFAPGEIGSRFIGWYLGTPNAGVWHIADGTAGVSSSTSAGLVVTVTMPNLIGSYVKGIAAYTGTVVAPIAPTFTGIGATTGVPSANVNVSVTGASLAVATGSHTHTITPAGTISATAEPQEVGLVPYYRL